MGTPMETVYQKMKEQYTTLMDQKDSFGEAVYTDLNDWLGQTSNREFDPKEPTPQETFKLRLQDLYKRCCQALDVEESIMDVKYPDYITSGIGTMKLHLWQLGYTEHSHIRGATSAYNVFKCMEKDCLYGGNTKKYPIEILPFMQGGLPGQEVEAFSVMTSIGSSVVTSAYIICCNIIKAGFFEGVVDASHPEQELARCVKSLMEVFAIYEPVEGIKEAVFKSNKGKIEAGKRPTPTILSYAASYNRVADDIQQKKKTRQTRKELVMKQVKEHNTIEKTCGSKIKTEDIQALSNVLEQSEWFQWKLKTIYQY